MGMFKTALTSAAFALGLSSVAAAETAILYGHGGPGRGTIPQALNWFSDGIGTLSDGDLRLDIQWGGALFKAPAAVSSIGDGVADAGSIISAYFQKEMAAYSLADLPIGGPNPWVALKAADRLMRTTPEITEHLAKQDLVYIGSFTAADVNVGCTGVEINSIADIEGLRVRGAGVYGKVFDQLGATMVNLNIYEAYQGLDTGLIDCTQGYSWVVPALKWHEVMDNYTVLNWGQIGGYGMFMNKDIYDTFTDVQKAALSTAGAELADKFAELVVTNNERALTAMRDGGYEKPVKLLEVSAEDSAALTAATQPFIDEWKENANSVGLDGEKLIAIFQAAVDEYSAEYEAEGYPWQRN